MFYECNIRVIQLSKLQSKDTAHTQVNKRKNLIFIVIEQTVYLYVKNNKQKQIKLARYKKTIIIICGLCRTLLKFFIE